MTELRDRIKETIETGARRGLHQGDPRAGLLRQLRPGAAGAPGRGASFATVDVLPDPAIRQELSALSNWPTIPQVFVRGELIGGADIVQELAANGELEATLEEKLGDGWRGPGTSA